MIVTVFKTTFKKAKPKEVYYRCYGQLNINNFRSDLSQGLLTTLDDSYGHNQFETTFLDVLNKHVLFLKTKIVRANEVPYVTKALSKAIVTRSRLENVYYRNKTEESKIAYRNQKKFYSRIYKTEKEILCKLRYQKYN